jgi:hypothetical protein
LVVIDNKDVNYDDLDSMLLTMDLRTLGELALDVVNAFCAHRKLDLPAVHDDEDQLTDDARVIAGAAWKSVLRMNDRREFAASVEADLAQLG